MTIETVSIILQVTIISLFLFTMLACIMHTSPSPPYTYVLFHPTEDINGEALRKDYIYEGPFRLDRTTTTACTVCYNAFGSQMNASRQMELNMSASTYGAPLQYICA